MRSNQDISYFALRPVTVEEVCKRPSPIAVYCIATQDMVHIGGGPEKAISVEAVQSLEQGALARSLANEGKLAAAMTHLRAIADIADDPNAYVDEHGFRDALETIQALCKSVLGETVA